MPIASDAVKRKSTATVTIAPTVKSAANGERARQRKSAANGYVQRFLHVSQYDDTIVVVVIVVVTLHTVVTTITFKLPRKRLCNYERRKA